MGQIPQLSTTALHDVVYGGLTKVVQLLINSGADISIQRNNRFTALDGSVYFCNDRVIKLLLEKGAVLPVRSIEKQRALHLVLDGDWKSLFNSFSITEQISQFKARGNE